MSPVFRVSFCLLTVSLITLASASLVAAQQKRSADEFAALAKTLAATGGEKERAEILERQKDLASPELTAALNNLGASFASQGLYPKAMGVFRIAHDVAERIDDAKGLAGASGNIGLVHFYQGDYDSALEPLQKSLQIAEKIGNQPAASRALNNLGLVYQGQGNPDLAMQAYRKCLEIAREREDKSAIAMALGNIGNLHNSQGNYRLAAETYQQSRTHYKEAGVKAGEGRVLHSLGNIQLHQGNPDLASELYRESLAIKEETGNRVEQARTLNALGSLCAERGDYRSAEEFHRKALALSEAADAKREVASSYYFLGGMYSVKGELDSASECFRKSLSMYETIGDKSGEGDSLNELAKIHLSRGESTLALKTSERATEIAKRIGSLEILWTALTHAGEAHRLANRPAQARRLFEEAVVTIEDLRSQMSGGEQETRRYFEAKISPYHELIKLLIAERSFGDALARAEQAKARALLDVLRHGKIDVQKAMNADEREQERRLKSQLTAINTQLTRAAQSDKPDAARVGEIKARLENARLGYEIFRTSLYSAHPELKIQRGETSIVSARQMTALLPSHTSALLEYVVAGDETYLFVVTKPPGKTEAEVRAYTLPVTRAALAGRIEAFRQQLAKRDLGFRPEAIGLYELLLKPAAAQLRGVNSFVIAPDDALWELPFQALIGGSNRFLIEDAAIAYAPSLTVLREMAGRRGRTAANRSSAALLALGNPLVGEDVTNRAAAAAKRGENLAALPEAEQEVKALSQLYGAARSKVYVGADAREDLVKSEAAQAGVLHFAAHGTLNNTLPMYSHLTLAGGDAEDGMLEAWELMQLDLNADLAVLSACETARGRAGAGEGMVGLSWAMFIAGVPSIVVSQWKVESAGTRDLMVNFHRALISTPKVGTAKPTKVGALRQAALKLMKNPETRHPFYWAGFVLTGDGQ